MQTAIDLEAYFVRPDTPMADSPVGLLMRRIVEKNPGIEFVDARANAHALLQRVAGRKRYRTPRVLSPEEQAQRDACLRVFRASREGRVNPDSCDSWV
jgi:hypothetical protein